MKKVRFSKKRYVAGRKLAAVTLASTIACGLAVAPAQARRGSNKAKADPETRDLHEQVVRNQEKYRELASRLEKTVSDASETLTRLTNEKSALLAEIDSVRGEVFKLRMKKEERTQDLDQKKSEVAGLGKALGEQQKLMSRLEKKIEDLTGKVPSYESALRNEQLLKEKDLQIDDLQARYSGLNESLERTERESSAKIKGLESKLADRQAAFKDLESAAEEMIARFASMEAALKREKIERLTAQRQAAEHEQEIRVAQTDLVKSRERVASLEESNGTLEHALRGSEIALANVSERLEGVEQQTQRLDEDYEAASSRSSVLATNLERVNREREELRRELTMRKDEVRELQMALTAAEREKKTAIADAKSSLELLENLLDKHQELIGALERVRSNMSHPTT